MEKEAIGIPKVEAQYRVAGEGEPACADCGNYISPDACKLVEGSVAVEATCDLFTPAEGAVGPEDALMEQLFGGM